MMRMYKIKAREKIQADTDKRQNDAVEGLMRGDKATVNVEGVDDVRLKRKNVKTER